MVQIVWGVPRGEKLIVWGGGHYSAHRSTIAVEEIFECPFNKNLEACFKRNLLMPICFLEDLDIKNYGTAALHQISWLLQ